MNGKDYFHFNKCGLTTFYRAEQRTFLSTWKISCPFKQDNEESSWLANCFTNLFWLPSSFSYDILHFLLEITLEHLDFGGPIIFFTSHWRLKLSLFSGHNFNLHTPLNIWPFSKSRIASLFMSETSIWISCLSFCFCFVKSSSRCGRKLKPQECFQILSCGDQ